MSKFASSLLVAAVGLFALGAIRTEASCPTARAVKKTRPIILIESPRSQALNPDSYDNGSPVIYVTGRIKGVPQKRLQVLVDGQPAATASGGHFAARVPSDTSQWFQPILVEATDTGTGAVTRERRIVFHGEADPMNQLPVAENAFVRVTSNAFDPATLTGKFEPDLRIGIQEQIDALDIPATLRARNPVSGYRCLAWAGALCHAWVDEANILSVSFSPVQAWAQSIAPNYGTNVGFAVYDVLIDLEVKGGINSFVRDWWCKATIAVDSVAASVYLKQTQALDGTPGKVQFWQADPTYLYNSPAFLQFYDWSSYPLETATICPNNQLDWNNQINAMLPGLLASISTTLDVGRPWDNPLPRTLTETVDAIHIAAPIADAIQKTIVTAYGDINAQTNQFGITYPLRTEIARKQAGECAPRIQMAYSPRAALPTFGSRATPETGVPYDIALGITPGAFNQLLASMIEEGALTARISEFGGQPLTLGAIRGLFQALPAQLGNEISVTIEVYPTVAPVVDNRSAPDGSGSPLLDLRQMMIDVNAQVRKSGAPTTILRMAFDLPLAFDLSVSPNRRTLTPEIRAYDPGALELFVLQNPYRAKEESLRAIVPLLVTDNIQALATLEPFSLGEVAGYQLEAVELHPFRPGAGWMYAYFRLVG